MNIIYLSQNHAKSMTDAKQFVRVYSKYNTAGKFNDNIQTYASYYDELMDQVLAR